MKRASSLMRAVGAGIALSALADAACADTAFSCLRLTEQPAIATKSLTPNERVAADFLRKHAQHIARHRGADGDPILIRLDSNNPQGSHLVAYVRGKDGLHTSLVVHSTSLGHTYSLVDARDTFQKGINEPEFGDGTISDGFSYYFRDAGSYHVHISDSVTQRVRPDGSTVAESKTYREHVITGYSFGVSYCR